MGGAARLTLPFRRPDYTLRQTFRAKVETRAGTVLSSATPQQVMDRRAKALELDASAPAKAAPKPKAP